MLPFGDAGAFPGEEVCGECTLGIGSEPSKDRVRKPARKPVCLPTPSSACRTKECLPSSLCAGKGSGTALMVVARKRTEKNNKDCRCLSTSDPRKEDFLKWRCGRNSEMFSVSEAVQFRSVLIRSSVFRTAHTPARPCAPTKTFRREERAPIRGWWRFPTSAAGNGCATAPKVSFRTLRETVLGRI